jgi:hypothetical protein
MAKTRKTVARQSVDLVQSYQTAFNTAQGTKVLYDLMDKHGMLHSTFDPNPYEMARKEGARNVVLRILTIMKTDPQQILQRIEEHEREMAE